MHGNVAIDEMFPRAEPVLRAPLPVLKTRSTYKKIRQRAADKGLKLNASHREVIEFVMDFYEHCDDCENARKLADIMRDEFADQGGRKYLYQLFPEGPLNTIHHLIDLPTLGHQHDRGFGTSF